MTEMRSVPFFNYPAQFLAHEEDYIRIMREVMRRGAYIFQKDLKDFEENLAHYLGVKHAFGIADGTDALIIGLKAMGIGVGDEVIVPSHTMVASAASIHFVGATPVLVDCGRDHLIDAESVARAITPKTRAIMPVQLNGRTANMDPILELARKHALKIIEDSAQALGSKFKGRFAGTFGSVGTFSFYPAKVLGCFGDGGALVTHDDEIARKVYMLRDHGRDPNGKVGCWGLNSRLDNIQAAVLDFKFKNYPQEIERRREIAGLYQEQLGGLRQLLLPPAPAENSDHFDVYQNYEIEAERRDGLKAYLDKNGIKTMIQWGGTPIHQMKSLGFQITPPYTEKMFTRCLMIPMNTTLSREDVNYVCRRIREFYR